MEYFKNYDASNEMDIAKNKAYATFELMDKLDIWFAKRSIRVGCIS